MYICDFKNLTFFLTYNFHDLLHTLELVLVSEFFRLWQFNLRSQGQVVSYSQLFVIWSGQLENIASVSYVPVTNSFQGDTIDIDISLLLVEGRERERTEGGRGGREGEEGGREGGREGEEGGRRERREGGGREGGREGGRGGREGGRERREGGRGGREGGEGEREGGRGREREGEEKRERRRR